MNKNMGITDLNFVELRKYFEERRYRLTGKILHTSKHIQNLK